MRIPRRTARVIVPAVVAGAGLLGWLVFGYFGAHLLFVDDRVDEPPPVFAAAGVVPPDEPVLPVPTPTAVAVPEPAAPAETVPLATSPPATVPPTTAPVPVVTTEVSGEFESISHPTRGRADVLGDGTGARVLRFEDFETDNGPDLNVYLVNSAAGGVSDVVDLGDLTGNVGSQNYVIPPEVDLSVYDTVLIWCVRFSSGFGSAELVPA